MDEIDEYVIEVDIVAHKLVAQDIYERIKTIVYEYDVRVVDIDKKIVL